MVYGDRGYRGCEGVIVCDSKDMRAVRQLSMEVGREKVLFVHITYVPFIKTA